VNLKPAYPMWADGVHGELTERGVPTRTIEAGFELVGLA